MTEQNTTNENLFLSKVKEYWGSFRDKFRIDPLMKKRLDRFAEIKKAKFSFVLIGVFFLLSLIAELFVSNRPLAMYVDGKLYFPTYGKVLLADDFNFRVGDELEVNYREFKKHIKEQKRGWILMPFVPYNPFETDSSSVPLALTFRGAPIMGISVSSKDALPMDNPADYMWIPLSDINGVKTGDKQYVWIKFADSADSKQPISDFFSNSKNWIGVAVNKSSSSESMNPADYIWHKIGSNDNRIDIGRDQILTVRFAKGDKGQMFHPLPPSFKTGHILGTDRIGRDIFARLVYGFRIAMSYALLVAAVTYFIGTIIGIAMGYFGGTFDIIFQRIIEIWERVPYLYMIMILASIFKPTFTMFVLINIAFNWTGKTWSMRAMSYRERERDYILAARSMGASTWRIITVHILPNVIVLIVTSLPFVISGGISSLTALDYLGYGLQPPTPSWGELLSIGTSTYAEAPWILLSVVTCFVLVLVMITFIGEGLRDAFDPRRFTVYK
ncbi:ABC transporter permease subunit [Treponema sp. OMZ 788]|uniref:ABC transporter permease subunit n=1 Tax=unclassified Treponema TaxID=2638727 RepID=UPI0020A5B979|nr:MULTISPECIES: ABC transporter permease subunit [unclassified Treponema]UTC62062.1 ABC transporter permease subunit [Treponema sp. OMZ 787]UTC64944.1 ABC transporter permease subunit [Treponema sp. OMZ 788]